MVIMFVRHGESKNDKLTKKGKIQCKLASNEKEKLNYAGIYSSSANRCVSTARYFQNRFKTHLTILNGLNERELLPNKTPQTDDEQEWYENYLNPMYSSTKPEGCKEFLARNFIEFKKIIETHFDKNENVVIVGHSCTFYALLAYLFGIQRGKDILWSRVSNCSKVYFEILEKE